MGQIAPPVVISPPARIPHRYGLYSAATVIDDPGLQHWENGVEWRDLPCDGAQTYAIACPTATPPPAKTFGDGGGSLVTVEPFAIYAGYTCSPVGESWTEARDRVTGWLTTGEPETVESAFMLGSAGASPSLVSPDTEDLTPTAGAISPGAGIAVLEDYLAGCHTGVGTIHMPRSVAVLAGNSGALTRAATRLETFVGTPVAAGSGYSKSNVGPDGSDTPPGEAWIYATGQVTIWRSSIFTLPGDNQWIDMGNNDRLLLAERIVAVGTTGCCVGAVRVRLCSCCGD